MNFAILLNVMPAKVKSLPRSQFKFRKVSAVIFVVVVLAIGLIIYSVPSIHRNDALAGELRSAFKSQQSAIQSVGAANTSMSLMNGCQTNESGVLSYLRNCTWSEAYFFPVQDTAHAAALGDAIESSIRSAFPSKPSPPPIVPFNSEALPVPLLAGQYQADPAYFNDRGIYEITNNGNDAASNNTYYYDGSNVTCSFELMYFPNGSIPSTYDYWEGVRIPESDASHAVTLASSCSSFTIPLIMTVLPSPKIT